MARCPALPVGNGLLVPRGFGVVVRNEFRMPRRSQATVW